jgi:hypothetical protein
MTFIHERMPSDIDNSHRVTFVCTAGMNYAGETLAEYQGKKSGDGPNDVIGRPQPFCYRSQGDENLYPLGCKFLHISAASHRCADRALCPTSRTKRERIY